MAVYENERNSVIDCVKLKGWHFEFCCVTCVAVDHWFNLVFMSKDLQIK